MVHGFAGTINNEILLNRGYCRPIAFAKQLDVRIIFVSYAVLGKYILITIVFAHIFSALFLQLLIPLVRVGNSAALIRAKLINAARFVMSVLIPSR